MSRTQHSKPKTKPFALRLTDDERKELDRRAGELALGTYIKGILFQDISNRRQRGARKPVKDHAALAQVLACLGQSRLGESLNSLSQAAESGTLHVDDDVPVALKKACDDIVVMRLLLMRALSFQMPEIDTSESVSQSFTRAACEED